MQHKKVNMYHINRCIITYVHNGHWQSLAMGLQASFVNLVNIQAPILIRVVLVQYCPVCYLLITFLKQRYSLFNCLFAWMMSSNIVCCNVKLPHSFFPYEARFVDGMMKLLCLLRTQLIRIPISSKFNSPIGLFLYLRAPVGPFKYFPPIVWACSFVFPYCGMTLRFQYSSVIRIELTGGQWIGNRQSSSQFLLLLEHLLFRDLGNLQVLVFLWNSYFAYLP